ncbi:HlyD family type I secretion periplasmic adaptor subunit [Chelatococcus sambhunathii]|uniref:Membrane fusion protein (MFP) family protein n=1 Tax=Chelatococcus sambhunathii TaxID=363953 RepID=A0ABU1DB18_9HYPH|nr:HlyD family type I secretion periplasmic adaptor subunit [Chelatococcus sambhunathii]MDR4305304.1 HlyD family type I secretion periplasmic adaptor subunit [Chelatococcus sambhunathii]
MNGRETTPAPAPLDVARRPIGLASRLRGVAITGAIVIFGFMGGFTVWASTAPLSAGAVVKGAIGPEASRKSVQHLEGGIVREILARDGDLVKKGQPLVTLERAQALAAVGQSRDTLSRRLAEAARLEAQISGASQIDFAEALAVAEDDPGFAGFMKEQQDLFETSVRDVKEKESLLRAQIAKLGEQASGGRARIAGSKDQLKLIEIQIADAEQLMEKGLARKPLLLDLQRRKSELETEMAALQSDIKRAEIEQVEKSITLDNTRTAFLNQSSADLAKARSEAAGLRAKLNASADILVRTQVLAPDTGYVLNSQVKTVGGVVKPGEMIMQIVPTEGDLIIEGKVAPQEIRNIETGQAARVSFTAFPMRDMPLLPGKVIMVGADALLDDKTQQTYYVAKVAVDRSAFAAYARAEEMKPGSPVEAYVEAKKRVAMEYFLEPVIHSFRRSFREQ